MSEQPGSEPLWERWGWLLGAVWIVYISVPMAQALRSDAAIWARVLTLGCLSAFAVIYVSMLYLTARRPLSLACRFTTVGALTALGAASIPLVGYVALILITYVVALSMFVLPQLAAVGVYITGLALTLTPALSNEFPDWWQITLMVAATGALTFTIRVVDERDSRNQVTRVQLGLVAERERVARDVHDVLGHSLTVVTVKAELAERLVDSDPARAKAELAEIRSLARQSLAEIRATVAGLRVARLADELTAARTALAGAGIAGQVPDHAETVDPRHRIVIAWSLREAITNVVRHSGAKNCSITLSENGITVSDDGCGLGLATVGNGLRGLRERVESNGGTVTISDGPSGCGTLLQVVLP